MHEDEQRRLVEKAENLARTELDRFGDLLALERDRSKRFPQKRLFERSIQLLSKVKPGVSTDWKQSEALAVGSDALTARAAVAVRERLEPMVERFRAATKAIANNHERGPHELAWEYLRGVENDFESLVAMCTPA